MQDVATWLMENGQRAGKVRRITCREGHKFVAMDDHPGTGAEFLCPHCAQEKISVLRVRLQQAQRTLAQLNTTAFSEWIPCYKEAPPHGVVLLVTFEKDGLPHVGRAVWDRWGGEWVISDEVRYTSDLPRVPAAAGTHWRFIPPPAPTMHWWQANGNAPKQAEPRIDATTEAPQEG